jgi:hypothetical protein
MMFFSSHIKLFDQKDFLLDIIFYASISNKPAREKFNYFYKKEAKKSIYFLKCTISFKRKLFSIF